MGVCSYNTIDLSGIPVNKGTNSRLGWTKYIEDITRWLEDMNFMFSWQEQYLSRSLRSLVRYCSCHSNIKFISSHHRVISSIYFSSSVERVMHEKFIDQTGTVAFTSFITQQA